MGNCGCGKNRNNRISKIVSSDKKSLTARSPDSLRQKIAKAKRKQVIKNKITFCKTCPHSIPTADERRRKARVCHRTKTSLQAIFNNPKFKCPLNNF